MFTKPLTRASKNILIKSFFLAIGYKTKDCTEKFLGQLFEDGLFISDSLCTEAPHPPPPNNPTSEKIGEGVSVR